MKARRGQDALDPRAEHSPDPLSREERVSVFARKTDDRHVTNASTPESTQPAERVFSPPAIVAAVFLALHVVPLFWRPVPMWGFDFLYYMPIWVQVAFVLLAVIPFVPRFQRLCRTCVTSLPFALWGQGRRVWVSRALVVLIALAGFLLLSSARHFLGDGDGLLGGLVTGSWTGRLRKPLTYAINETLHNVGADTWETVENTYRTYSTASGVLYLLFSFPVATLLGNNNLERSIVLAFLLTAGYIQLFFGYVEHYALYMPGLLLYLYLGLRTCKGRAPLYLPALLMGSLLALHRGFLVFGPSLLFLAYRCFRSRQYRIPTWKNALATVAALCCMSASTVLFLAVCGVGVHEYLFRADSSQFLPLFDKPGFRAQYRIFSLTHIIDWLNQYLLAAPAACMALFLLRKKDLSHHAFLAVCTVVPLFFSFAGNPELGAFRDWDAWSLPALPLSLWVAALILNRIRDGVNLSRGAFLICGAAALHSCLWVGLNASAESSEARFVHLTERLEGNACVLAWMAVGKVQLQEKRYPEALHAHKRARDANPADPNRWLLVGTVYREMGQSANAIEYYKTAQELQPDLPTPYMNLGAVYSDLGQFGRAIEHTRKAIALDPGLASAQMNLGSIYRKTGRPDKAIRHLEKAAALRPGNGAVHGHLGMAYRDLGNYAKAVEHLQRAYSIRPRHVETVVNLAVACSDAGQNDRAIELLREAVILRPGLAAVHVNLGAVYGRIDQYGNAIRHLSRARELQPDNPETYRNLGLIYKAQGRYPDAIEQFEKVRELQSGRGDLQTHLNLGDTYYHMRQHEKAIPHYRKALQLNPNHANAHLLLGLSFRALNRNGDARTYFERVLELEPNHSHAARVKQWLGQLRE